MGASLNIDQCNGLSVMCSFPCAVAGSVYSGDVILMQIFWLGMDLDLAL
jgi:hypothetical protein